MALLGLVLIGGVFALVGLVVVVIGVAKAAKK
jgi:hypothetical protein